MKLSDLKWVRRVILFLVAFIIGTWVFAYRAEAATQGQICNGDDLRTFANPPPGWVICGRCLWLSNNAQMLPRFCPPPPPEPTAGGCHSQGDTDGHTAPPKELP